MLISLDDLIKKYDIKFKGILHIGAHECEEINVYESYVTREKILWIDALEDKVNLCKYKYENLLIECAVISDVKNKVVFNRSNNGQSSSILDFGTHSFHHPYVQYVSSYEVETIPTRDILKKYKIDFNFLNLDIQGAELNALKGMSEYLENVDYIYTEVNNDYVYKNCALISEIDSYLNTFDFVRVETCWYENTGWGDAFYIKKSNL